MNKHKNTGIRSSELYVTACLLHRYSPPAPRESSYLKSFSIEELPLTGSTLCLSLSPSLCAYEREAMALSSWFCTNNTKNMVVKIVHPGGHVELYDRPVLAAEVMLRNPRCYLAHPTVFHQPWAIVAPETMLTLGQKFYVVPMSTIRKLQRLSARNSPHATDIKSTHNGSDEKSDGMINSGCRLLVNKSAPKLPNACPKPAENKGEKLNTGTNAKRSGKEKGYGCLGEDNCFMCLLTRVKINAAGDDARPETRPSNMGSSGSKKDDRTRKRTMEFASKGIKVSPKKRVSFVHWEPSLESIEEE